MSQRTGPTSRGIVVFERHPFWGPELKRQVSDQNILVRECRSVHDLTSLVSEFSEVVTVIVLDAAPTEFLSWLTRQVATTWPSEIVVIASKSLSEVEWPIREAGATEFVDDEIPGVSVARICLRILRKASSGLGRVAAASGQ
ncbi:MAG: hypothetical protein WCJ09_00905 [Planctomycetota bacterium]